MSDKDATRAKDRPKRIPIGTRQVLAARERPGFHRRWVNDVGDRIQQFIDAGYTTVSGEVNNTSDDSAQTPSKLGNTVRRMVGENVYAVLMEIPQEFYDEDQTLKQERVDEVEASYDPNRQITERGYGQGVRRTRGR